MQDWPASSVDQFLASHHVLCLATIVDGAAYTAALFYDYSARRVAFYFLSSSNTVHARSVLASPTVAASVFSQDRNVALLQGIQLTGRAVGVPVAAAQSEPAFLDYQAKFPECRQLLHDKSLYFFTLTADWIKFTDNTAGFGRKYIWSRS